jgi:hypothetical protein
LVEGCAGSDSGNVRSSESSPAGGWLGFDGAFDCEEGLDGAGCVEFGAEGFAESCCAHSDPLDPSMKINHSQFRIFLFYSLAK